METTTAITTNAPVNEGTVTTGEIISTPADIINEAAIETAETTEARDYWTPESLLGGKEATLPILGKGMLGIFLVMGIIILCVTALNYFGSPDRKKKKAEKKAAKAQANNSNQ